MFDFSHAPYNPSQFTFTYIPDFLFLPSLLSAEHIPIFNLEGRDYLREDVPDRRPI